MLFTTNISTTSDMPMIHILWPRRTCPFFKSFNNELILRSCFIRQRQQIQRRSILQRGDVFFYDLLIIIVVILHKHIHSTYFVAHNGRAIFFAFEFYCVNFFSFLLSVLFERIAMWTLSKYSVNISTVVYIYLGLYRKNGAEYAPRYYFRIHFLLHVYKVLDDIKIVKYFLQMQLHYRELHNITQYLVKGVERQQTCHCCYCLLTSKHNFLYVNSLFNDRF